MKLDRNADTKSRCNKFIDFITRAVIVPLFLPHTFFNFSSHNFM